MKVSLRRRVWNRARDQCEYCRILQDHQPVPHHIDHVIALKHGGSTTAANLALACSHCSLAKGSNIAAIDRRSGELTRLFHPRSDPWQEHFVWRGATLVGRTAIGRVTISVLNINLPDRITTRAWLIAAGVASFENT